jgi:hypothetical protein
LRPAWATKQDYVRKEERKKRERDEERKEGRKGGKEGGKMEWRERGKKERRENGTRRKTLYEVASIKSKVQGIGDGVTAQ